MKGDQVSVFRYIKAGHTTQSMLFMDHLAKEKEPLMPHSLLLYNLIGATVIMMMSLNGGKNNKYEVW